jgi:hypothetical protein
MAPLLNLRDALPFSVLSFFVLYFFSSGLRLELSGDFPGVLVKGPSQSDDTSQCIVLILSLGFPDFGNYRHIGTVPAEQLSLGSFSYPRPW